MVRLCVIVLAAWCFASLSSTAVAQTRAAVHGDRLMLTGDTSTFVDSTWVPLGDGTVLYDSSSGNFVFYFRGRRWLLPDSLPTSGGAGGRTYLRDARATAHAGLGNLDSTDALYTLDWNFGTLNFSGVCNFSNNGGAGSDSTQFQFNGVSFYGILAPTDVAYPLTFERVVVKTSYSSILSSTFAAPFPSNVTHSSDSTVFSVHIKTEYVGGTRYYFLRIYKLARDSFNGVAVPVTAGTLVASVQVATDRFPTYGTSVQLRIDLWARRL